MRDYSTDFGPFGDVLWLNTSHQGPLPKVAVSALEEATGWKRSPHRLIDSALFSDIPKKLRDALGRLINCPSEDIILGNSASYGLHLLANGIRWQPGDEVLVVRGDFPATILPWLGLAERGVTVRAVELSDGRLDPETLADSITDRTRLFCSSWVFSFWGIKLNLKATREICRRRGVKVVLNCSQAIGTQPFNVGDGYADAITNVGFKWLCGPYGTGFCWVEPEFRESLSYNQAYWLAMQTADDLKVSQQMPQIKDGLGARKYDVFGTANFFNFMPWTASVNYLLGLGIETVKEHNDQLISYLIDGLDPEKFEIKSPTDTDDRSTILIVSHRQPNRNPDIFSQLQTQNIYISLRNGRLRFAPHIYNTIEQIDRVLEIMNGV